MFLGGPPGRSSQIRVTSSHKTPSSQVLNPATDKLVDKTPTGPPNSSDQHHKLCPSTLPEASKTLWKQRKHLFLDDNGVTQNRELLFELAYERIRDLHICYR